MRRTAPQAHLSGDGHPQGWYANCALYQEELNVYRGAWMRQEPSMYTDQMAYYGPKSVYEDRQWDG